MRNLSAHLLWILSFGKDYLTFVSIAGSPVWRWSWNLNCTSLLIEEHIPEFSMVPSSQTGRAGSCEVFSQQKAKEGKVNAGAWDIPPRKDWLNERELWKFPKLSEIKSCLLLRLGASFQEKHKVLWGGIAAAFQAMQRPRQEWRDCKAQTFRQCCVYYAKTHDFPTEKTKNLIWYVPAPHKVFRTRNEEGAIHNTIIWYYFFLRTSKKIFWISFLEASPAKHASLPNI